MVRELLKKLTRGRVFQRRLPKRFGGRPILVSPELALRFCRWSMDEIGGELFDVVERYVKPGDTVWDVGANAGLLALASAHRVGPTGQVVAFEPDTMSIDLLQKTCRLDENSDVSVQVIPAAVSDQLGMAQLHIAQEGRSSNFLNQASLEKDRPLRYTHMVPTITLDWFLEQGVSKLPDFIKIDVEGSEQLVMLGAKQVMEQGRPIVFCEVNEAQEDAMTELFQANGYRCFDADQAMAPTTKACFNTLAIPEEKYQTAMAA